MGSGPSSLSSRPPPPLSHTRLEIPCPLELQWTASGRAKPGAAKKLLLPIPQPQWRTLKRGVPSPRDVTCTCEMDTARQSGRRSGQFAGLVQAPIPHNAKRTAADAGFSAASWPGPRCNLFGAFKRSAAWEAGGTLG